MKEAGCNFPSRYTVGVFLRRRREIVSPEDSRRRAAPSNWRGFMSRRVGGLVFAWSLIVPLLVALSVGAGAWAGLDPSRASRPGAAVVAGERDRRAAPSARQGRESRESRPPVLCWELLNQDIYIYRHDMGSLDWRRIREQREIRKNASQNPKHLKLQLGRFTAGSFGPAPLPSKLLKDLRLLVRDPNGEVRRLTPLADKKYLASIPDRDEINGRYILSAQLNLGIMDVNRDGIGEKIILYAKQFVTHYRQDLSLGSSPDVFFNNAEQLAFEIGPVVDNAKSKYGGGMQRPHQLYEMMVKYKNRPLAGGVVSVYVEGGGWQGRFITDSKGVITIMPTDDRFGNKDWQKYIYAAEHHDADDHSYHIASLSVIVKKNRAEWRSKAMGFTYWAIIGGTLILLLAAGLSLRKRRRDKQSLAAFESCRIKED